MEKKKPHYDLDRFKRLFRSEKNRLITKRAYKEAAKLGISSDQELIAIIESLNISDFYKSMTVYGNSKNWQDVYKKAIGGNNLYIKIQLSFPDESGAILIQCKRDEGEDND